MARRRPQETHNQPIVPSREALRQARRDGAAVVDGRTIHGDIDAPAASIVDAQNGRGAPFRRVDTIATMLRSGSISKPMAQAADHFRSDFHRADLDTLRAAPMIKVARANPNLTIARIAARNRLHAALAVLGGMASPAGSAMWHVVGCEESLRAWALREGWRGRAIRQQVATGILISALGALAVHYGYEGT